MKVLVVGSGGREHALAWKLKADDPSLEIVATPGNAGIAALARCVPVRADDISGLAAFATAEEVTLTIVGPEAALAAGIVDAFRARDLAIFGPTAASAKIESSKAFAKRLMGEAGVPTGKAFAFRESKPAKRAARELGAPVVVKASGLAAGKGVTVAETLDEADAAIDRLLTQRILGEAGDDVLIEEFLEGEELSLFVLTDGTRAIPMLPAQDHKRLGEGDTGPNTGGMGAYAPVSIATPIIVGRTMREIVKPTLAWLRDHRTPFTGLLYVGLMLTRDGPKVVEFNCRFGDPETQAVLPLLKSSLVEPLSAIARGESLSGIDLLRWYPGAALTTVVAARGYPDKPRTGDPIEIPPETDDIIVFHAGTARDASGVLVSAGGRVLSVTAIGRSVKEAAARSRQFAETMEFQGKQFRRDIGWREVARCGE